MKLELVRSGQCPSCGAGIQFASNSATAQVCKHCNFVIARTDRDFRAIGRVADLVPIASPLTVGTMGVPYRRVWLFELVGAASWSLVWLGVGVLGGTVLEALGFREGELGPWMPVLWIGGAAIVGVLVWCYYDRLKRLALGEDEPTRRAPLSAS